MANIQGDALYDQKEREFKMEGAGSRRFQLDYLSALNRSIAKININADLATRIDQVTSRTDEIGLDLKYEYILSRSITRELALNGQSVRKGAEGLIPSDEEILNLIDEMRQDIENTTYGEDDYETMGIYTG